MPCKGAMALEGGRRCPPCKHGQFFRAPAAVATSEQVTVAVCYGQCSKFGAHKVGHKNMLAEGRVAIYQLGALQNAQKISLKMSRSSGHLNAGNSQRKGWGRSCLGMKVM